MDRENKKLLPGGSRVEGFEIDQRGARRQRRAAVFAICSFAAVACLAASVSHGAKTELLIAPSKPAAGAAPSLHPAALQQSVSLADQYLKKHGVPSWLATGQVKLKPLNVMIHEQLAAKEMQKKVVEKTLKKAEAQYVAKSKVTPHDLAMKNALHIQAAKKVAQVHKHIAATKEAAKMTSAKMTSAKTQELAEADTSKYHKGAVTSLEGDLEKVRQGIAAEKSVVEVAELAQLQAIREEEERVHKDEVHKLAQLKKNSLTEEKRLVQEIMKMKELKSQKIAEERREARKDAEHLSMKLSIKAEMAKIEDEEHEKLAALKKKMEALDKSADTKEEHKEEHKVVAVLSKGASVQTAKEAEKDMKVAAVASKGTSSLSTKTVRAHKVAQKPAVKLHSSNGDQVDKVLKGCTTAKCDLAVEDKQWKAIGGKVDQYAKEAQSDDGDARKQALAHMKYLQDVIEKDYKHVTDFAVAQEHALPPAPHM
jgi:hypothetical protein